MLLILDATKMLDVAWHDVAESELTVVNCFAKAGISKEQQNTSLEDSDKPAKELQEQMDKLVVRAPNFLPDGITADCVTDNNVLNTEPPVNG